MYPSLLKQKINYREKCRNIFLIGTDGKLYNKESSPKFNKETVIK